ncbi:hypothetical protein IQ266_15905 [filamentous cyanobacterium LEGE 11480]|uniref:Uncharacterized protein n=1 Tax=Romeriopsis navalis LEGE 11480 TaxID=2777977 RepID=A0A928Z401_9CYAN|nr:hypothetical protein [Romeriopsis navalis]MBE9031219.1 hypothetical protein [Romeriopsis navalis LEGE 11480]
MKLMHRILFVPAIALAILPSMTANANAQSALNRALQSCNRISDPLRRGNCQSAMRARQAQMDLVRSWTPHQRSLARQISQITYTYFQRNGQPIPVNRNSVLAVMQMIGANRQDIRFVIDRMRANYNAAIGINQADRLIKSTSRFLRCLERQGTGCVPGR